MSERVTGLGYAGQRYEVRGTYHTGGEVAVGWTNERNGGKIFADLQGFTRFASSRVVDLYPGIETILENWLKWKAGCRKCVSELYNGKGACGYCSMRFELKRWN